MAIVSIKELEARAAARAAADASTHGGDDATLRDQVKGAYAEDGDESPSAADHFAVGYGRPPAKHQFRKGDGRPRGPAKGSRRVKSPNEYFAEELAALIGVRTGDRLKKMPAVKALAKKSVQDALKGDRHARRDVLNIAALVFPAQSSPVSSVNSGSETDANLIALYLDGLQLGEPMATGDSGGQS